MKKEEVSLTISDYAGKLQDVVLSVTGKEGLIGFNKAYMMASGIIQLRELLTPEYMAPIMQLQGSRLGFRTDRDKNQDGSKGPGYPMEVVRECIIEATLNGYEVTGNQFNIIASGFYPTKEGTSAKLNKVPGLKPTIICGLPKLNAEGTSAAVEVSVKWKFNSEDFIETLNIPIRVNKAMGLDAIVGKAKRKANYWLLERISGVDIAEFDVEDIEHKVVSSSPLKKDKEQSDEEIEAQRWLALFKDCKTEQELAFYESSIPDELKVAFQRRMDETKRTK